MMNDLAENVAASPAKSIRRLARWRIFVNLALFGIFIFVVMIELAGAYAGYREVDQILYPKRNVFCCETPADFDIAYQDVEIQTSDDLTLYGWYLLPQSNASIVMAHGVGGNRSTLSSIARRLHEDGYGVLLLDMRAHGESEGEIFTRGWLDIVAAAEYLNARGVEHIGAYGFSLGANMVIHGAAQSDLIEAVVIDGASPAVLSDMPLPNNVSGWLYILYDVVYWTQLEARSGQYGGFAALPMLDAVKLVAPRPLLIIAAGAEPSGFEERMARRLAKSYGETADLWIIEDVFHGGGFSAHPDVFAERVNTFFDAALAPESISSAGE